MLVDVTETAREAGFKLHTVVSRKVWDECVAVPPGVEGRGQSEAWRLWDVLFIASTAARSARGDDLVTFKVLVLDGLRPDGSPRHSERELWLHVCPGDEAEPVLTIMFPEDY